jgi:dephospho-CoA kinase
MRLIGLTGGIATGKSTFAAALRALGAPVVDADELARRVVRCGTPTLAEIERVFGPEILTPEGDLDRRRMAALVFADPTARARLEAITHPAIRRAMREEVRRLSDEGRDLAFYEAPLLFEVGLDREVDCVVLVYAPPEIQERRLQERDGLRAEEVRARLAAQMPIEEKAARADVLVENEGDPAALAGKASALLADLRAGLGRRLPNGQPARY